MFGECQSYISDIEKSLFSILERQDNCESLQETIDWSEFLALNPECKVKILCIKILANGVLGMKSTGPLFYSFFKFFERIIDSEGEYIDGSSVP